MMTSADGDSAAFAGADADALGKLHDKDFTIADRAGMRALGDGGNGRFDKGFVDGDIQADFIEQAACFLGAAVNFRDAFLPSPGPPRW